ncbi:MAG TPA: flagellar hook-length control protein FliK [Anaerolineales bacterium]|nr:flagellar hook-length control protein FliK [Anaerolineales bacterium]HNB35703.1 flagellar hook-length control protein FliK [Anaerolineales bacterium]HNF36724.1 flagellar hook-length control protein FliK [Anaerolineales bacterium]
MIFPGPISISPINNTNGQSFDLRVFQRITAQVLSVTGTTAVLEVEGHPVVAQLTSADQSALLSSQRTAQFVITQLGDNSVTLKLIKNEQTFPAGTAFGPDLAERFLENNNLPITTSNLVMTRALLRQHLPITPRTLKELQGALSEYGDWGEAEADLAAAIKSAGLPLTGQSLALSARRPAPTAQAFSQLMATLAQAAKQNLPENLLEQLRSNLQFLNSLILDRGGDSSRMADQLKAWAEAFGRSLENILLSEIQNGAESISKNNLIELAKLQNLLEQFGRQETARSLKEFLTDIRREQLMNVRSDSPSTTEWLEIGFALPKANKDFASARLRIARDGTAKAINPASTRLVLQVDLSPAETVEVDLSFAGKQIRSSVTSPNPAWCKQAQAELPSLTDALAELGYTLTDFQVDVQMPQSFNRLQSGTGSIDLMTVNIEV